MILAISHNPTTSAETLESHVPEVEKDNFQILDKAIKRHGSQVHLP